MYVYICIHTNTKSQSTKSFPFSLTDEGHKEVAMENIQADWNLRALGLNETELQRLRKVNTINKAKLKYEA